MEPLTTIGLISNIVSFVDWGTRVVRGTLEIYNSASGASASHQAQETLVRETRDFIIKLDIPKGPWEEDRRLRLLADECQSLAQAILDKLQIIKPAASRSKVSAFWSALKSDGARNGLDLLEDRLDRCRNQLAWQLNLITR